MNLTLDRIPQYRYAVLSMRQDRGGQVELESSFVSEGQARLMFERQYSKWGFTDTNFYLVDWQTQKVLLCHQTFTSKYTDVLCCEGVQSSYATCQFRMGQPGMTWHCGQYTENGAKFCKRHAGVQS